MNSSDQSQILKSEPTNFSTNIYYDFFFNWQVEKKNYLGPIRSLFSFSTAQKGNSWKKLVKQIGENI